MMLSPAVSILLLIFTASFGSGLLASCASRGVEIVSSPAGAEVVTLGGESLGKTPLVLSGEAYDKAVSSSLLSLRLLAEGHLSKEIFAPADSLKSISVQLSPRDDGTFKKEILSGFARDHNRMLREALRIQGLVQLNKSAEAEPLIDAFAQSYPGLAYPHVMRANLELLAGRKAQARVHVARAVALDPEDPVILQMLKTLEAVTPSGGGKP